MAEHQLDMNVVKKIVNDTAFFRKIIIYGTSPLAVSLAELLKAAGHDIDCFVDDRVEMNALGGKPVRHVYDLLFDDLSDRFILVVKPSMPFYSYIAVIMYELGLKKRVDYADAIKRPTGRNLYYLDANLGNNFLADLPGFVVYGDRENPQAVRVVTLGGSTSDSCRNTMFDNAVSWPEYLYRRLRAINANVVVYSGGVGGYEAAQELIKLVRDIIPLRPRLVVSYSGLNDASRAAPKDASLNRHQRPFVSTDTERFYRLNLARSGDILYGGDTVIYGMRDRRTAAQYWVDAMRAMRSLATEFSAEFLSFLQPSVFTTRPGAYTEAIIADSAVEYTMSSGHNYRLHREFAIEARELVKAHSFIVDCTELFDGRGDDIYYDPCHVTSKGNEIIAERIAVEIKTRGLLQAGSR